MLDIALRLTTFGHYKEKGESEIWKVKMGDDLHTYEVYTYLQPILLTVDTYTHYTRLHYTTYILQRAKLNLLGTYSMYLSLYGSTFYRYVCMYVCILPHQQDMQDMTPSPSQEMNIQLSWRRPSRRAPDVHLTS